MDSLSSLRFLGLGGDGAPSIEPSPAGEDASPRLVHRGARTAVYRSRDAGIKLALAGGENPPSEGGRGLLLAHELNVSNYLPQDCACKRRAIEIASFHGRPALVFRWAEGATLGEWMRGGGSDQGDDVDMAERLRVAVAIARALCDFHDGGVAYNSLSPDDVVLTMHQGNYAATLIDLSRAIIYRGSSDAALEERVKTKDLNDLGLVMNQLFQGCKSSNEGSGGMDEGVQGTDVQGGGGRNKRGKQHRPGEGLLPPYLSSLVSALLDCRSSERQIYSSAKEVLLDLNTMAENPKKYLANSKTSQSIDGCLHLQEDMFYGRQVQMSMLLHLFQSSVVEGKQPLMAMIAGSPGIGKSTLVKQMKKPLLEKNGCFIEGKFDKSVRPDTVLASAMNRFFGDILNSDRNGAHSSLRMRVEKTIPSGSNNMLLEIIPNLRKWLQAGRDDAAAVGNASSTSPVSSMRPSPQKMGSRLRHKFMMCKLISAIACHAQPLILFLDDLQWADENTLDIIQLVMTDPTIRHFLLLGCYRDNEVFHTHPLKKSLNVIQEQGLGTGMVGVTIKVGPIEKECINTMLSDALSMPPGLCRPLSTVVHNKTGGVILFIKRFLSSLNEEGFLSFCMSSRRWVYDLQKMSEKEIHEDVVSHMTEHMTRLSKRIQEGLMIAACLGPLVHAEVLNMAEKDNEIDDTFLDICVNFGFLRCTGSQKYVWAHDQIQQAAYDLIPQRRRNSFHLLIGTRIVVKCQAPAKVAEMIFFIVDNMNRGAELIEDQEQRHELSRLNLQAGNTALASSAFYTGSKNFLMGLMLLGPDSWEEEYDLTMRLYDAASEALYAIGDFSTLFSLIQNPLTNARSFEEKLNIYHNTVRAHSASLQHEEGIAMCLDITRQLGEVIPMDITVDVYREEVAQVKKLLSGKSQSELLSLPIMTESQKLAAMQFMNHALLMTYIARPMLNPILVFRMVRMSIDYGVCNVSSFAFACYGAWLVSQALDDFEGGHRMGLVAIEMMKRLNAAEMIPRIYCMVYAFINIWKEPWQASLSKHSESFESGMATGDVEFGITALSCYANTAIYCCGANLQSLSQDIEIYTKRAHQLNQHGIWKCLLSLHQLTLDLNGAEENAFSPYSDVMTEDSLFESTLIKNESTISRVICNKRKFVAFLMGDLGTASKMFELSQKFPFGNTGRGCHLCVMTFIDGLIGYFFARKHCEEEGKWSNVGRNAKMLLEKWASSSEWNFTNKLQLLEAENAYFLGDDAKAITCYTASIKAAREHRFVHEEGLAEEKAATFFLHKQRKGEALAHLVNAKKCYEIWGALALVKRMDHTIELLSTMNVDADTSNTA